MMWLVFALGVVVGFVLGVIAVRRLIHEERKKALAMATALINAHRCDEPQAVHASVSFGCPQQFNYEVIFGGGSDGTE